MISQAKRQQIREIIIETIQANGLSMRDYRYSESSYRSQLKTANHKRQREYCFDLKMMLRATFSSSLVSDKLFDKLFYELRLLPSLSEKSEVLSEVRSLIETIIDEYTAKIENVETTERDIVGCDLCDEDYKCTVHDNSLPIIQALSRFFVEYNLSYTQIADRLRNYLRKEIDYRDIQKALLTDPISVEKDHEIIDEYTAYWNNFLRS